MVFSVLIAFFSGILFMISFDDYHGKYGLIVMSLTLFAIALVMGSGIVI